MSENTETASSYRALELERLDAMNLKAWAVMESANSMPAQVLQAVATLLRIAERRAKLLGLDDLPPTPPDPKAATREWLVPKCKYLTTDELLALREMFIVARARSEGAPVSLRPSTDLATSDDQPPGTTGSTRGY